MIHVPGRRAPLRWRLPGPASSSREMSSALPIPEHGLGQSTASALEVRRRPPSLSIIIALPSTSKAPPPPPEPRSRGRSG